MVLGRENAWGQGPEAWREDDCFTALRDAWRGGDSGGGTESAKARSCKEHL